MARKEFSTSVKVAALKRAMRDGVIYCEVCGRPAKKVEFDHEIPDAMGGKPVLENCKASCRECHAEKTTKDIANISKAKRREAKHLGVSRAKGTINSANTLRVKRTDRAVKMMPPRRPMFEDIGNG